MHPSEAVVPPSSCLKDLNPISVGQLRMVEQRAIADGGCVRRDGTLWRALDVDVAATATAAALVLTEGRTARSHSVRRLNQAQQATINGEWRGASELHSNPTLPAPNEHCRENKQRRNRGAMLEDGWLPRHALTGSPLRLLRIHLSPLLCNRLTNAARSCNDDECSCATQTNRIHAHSNQRAAAIDRDFEFESMNQFGRLISNHVHVLSEASREPEMEEKNEAGRRSRAEWRGRQA